MKIQPLNITAIASAILVCFTIIMSLLICLPRVDSFLRNQAVDQCEKNSRYEKTVAADSAKLITTVNDTYNTCLRNKGYK
jgi:hypothetical protein